MIKDAKGIKETSGFSLITVLVAVAITGILAVTIAGMQKNQFDVQKKLTNSIEVNAIKMTIVQNTSCSRTVAACSSATYVPMRRADNSIVFLGTGMHVGQNFYVRGKCATSGTYLEEIQMSRSLVYDGQFLPDPLTKQPMDWKSLFGGNFAAAPCGAPPSPASCNWYSLNYITGDNEVNGGASPNCNWAQVKDSCACPDHKKFTGFDLYDCGDGNPTRARCQCCD